MRPFFIAVTRRRRHRARACKKRMNKRKLPPIKWFPCRISYCTRECPRRNPRKAFKPLCEMHRTMNFQKVKAMV
jgi:hypothetical protein